MSVFLSPSLPLQVAFRETFAQCRQSAQWREQKDPICMLPPKKHTTLRHSSQVFSQARSLYSLSPFFASFCIPFLINHPLYPPLIPTLQS